jgi:spore coat polysaccharide biosynthesis protein SpsF (cytidylyltransferase family)
MKILAITQARIGSTRFPEKVVKEIDDKSLLQIHLERIKKSKLITKLVVATTHEAGVERIINICEKADVNFFQGSLEDVLERFYLAAKPYSPDWIVRLTSDCPLIDPEIIDAVISTALNNNFDYTSNTLNPTYPDGLDVEVFKFSALEYAYLNASQQSEREHVTPFIWKNSSNKGGTLFTSYSYENNQDYSQIRLTVDTLEDFELIRNLISLYDINSGWEVYTQEIIKNPALLNINAHYKRNEGYQKSINKENLS